MFGKDVRRIEMKKSYRNTAEIAEYAKSLTEVKGIEYVNRHGKAVEELSGYSLTEAADKILDIIGNGNESYETMAVLTMTEDEAREIYEHIRKIREDVSYIDRDSSVFRKGITVTTYYMAKGLEFDQVFVAGGEKHNPFYKQFQYISATRALHELYIFE
jgi:DNA helicase-2/ATP-dependent DNA helicase PcrA